jgi:nitroreductase
MATSSKRAPEKSATAEQVLRALRQTRQVREFRPDPVPDAVLDQLLEVARWTGSAMNRQPWTFIVVRERPHLDQLAALAPTAGHLKTAPAAIAIAMPGENAELDGFDEGRAAERILVGAGALGLAAGIGWAQGPKRAPVSEFLGLRPPAFVRTLISIGYPTETAAAPKSAPGTARKPLKDIVRYEHIG